jgi:hypothetical protein
VGEEDVGEEEVVVEEEPEKVSSTVVVGPLRNRHLWVGFKLEF